MFRQSKNSDEINPWTFRQRQTSRQFNEKSPAACKPIKSLREKHIIPKKYLNNPFNTDKHTQNLYYSDVIPEHSQRIICGKLPKHSIQNEALAQIQKTLPNYKFINFQYRNRPLKRKSKEKKLIFNSNSMRQYTEGLEIASKRQEKTGSRYEKLLKVKRYFTEEKDYEDYSDLIVVKKQDLIQISKTEQLKKPQQQSIKIVKSSKNHSREEIITKGKLFDQVQNICDRKGISGGGHLSIMKRNYNIKKLQKLLKQDLF